MNKLEQFIHGLIGDYPWLRIPLVAVYQRACSIVPSKNYEAGALEACHHGYFYGFHDKIPWSSDDSKLLAHRFDTKGKFSDAENDSVDIGYFENNFFHAVGSTKAWNWQQGATLQWIGNTNKIIYNDIENGACVSRLVDLEQGVEEKIPCHIMAVSDNGTYALSCSYSRLGIGMPGYGYTNFSNKNDNELLPANEGISVVDMSDKVIKRIISLEDIVGLAPKDTLDGSYHFFTHCLFSPGSKRFAFFHRYLCKNGQLDTRMFSAELDGGNIWQFSGDKFSHIAWYDEKTMLAYCQPEGYKIGLYLLEEFTGKVKSVASNDITSDGHPQVSSNGKYILIDTYPDRCRNQRLMLYDVEHDHCELLVKYKIPFKYRLEKRCDFHPRWSRDNKMICFDSAHTGIRSLCVIRNPVADA